MREAGLRVCSECACAVGILVWSGRVEEPPDPVPDPEPEPPEEGETELGGLIWWGKKNIKKMVFRGTSWDHWWHLAP